jgi:4-hydroxybenzoate polyprenyltransferase
LNHLRHLVQLARPGHWVKNLFVLAALVFARKVGDAHGWLVSLGALAAFCLASSAVYALNDVVDRREDAAHPQKRRRPVASGALGVRTAIAFSVVLAAAGLVLALAVGPPFAATVGAYLVLMAAYTFALKRVAILDVLLIASGFVLRAYAGGVALDVEVSHWLLLCTLTLSLFLGFAKREAERVALGPTAVATRPVAWAIYTERALEHMMTVSAGLAIVTYMLYTVSERTIREVVGGPWLFVTVLPVVYAVFRFYSRAIAGEVSGPVEMIRRDRPFLVALAAWAFLVALVMVLSRPASPGGP